VLVPAIVNDWGGARPAGACPSVCRWPVVTTACPLRPADTLFVPRVGSSEGPGCLPPPLRRDLRRARFREGAAEFAGEVERGVQASRAGYGAKLRRAAPRRGVELAQAPIFWVVPPKKEYNTTAAGDAGEERDGRRERA
jgi:hypothetical protein